MGADWGHGSLGRALIVVAVNAQRKTFLVSEMNLIAPWECAYRVLQTPTWTCWPSYPWGSR